jgi:hypothetical protein
MAKKTPAPAPLTYTARADDLKILGYVEAASDREALQKARKRFGATSVERRDSDAPAPADQLAAEATAGTKKTARKGKQANADAALTSAQADSSKAAPARRRASRSQAEPNKLGALDAAALVLAEAGTPLSCQEMITAMAAKNYWSSPQGRTPAATLYTAVTMLPKLAPCGARVKRARGNPVDDSDLLRFDLDAFYQAANDLAPRFPVGAIKSFADLACEDV